ncbi:TIGR02996 domain-containing protein [Telmatocola sphagniphila]|uniref:TIGR02996 domain-containing protein n=1 Tax=Telmatocola sphagniphila TaxID=1123043 RepID=A0A8E6EUR7_9BACT|nr:TIGR02996 domain-containing protein [Telmatocola sphagniphila]QVL31627.1 TIGR02996 domain-containing protein [Telmatocola sphagniphila]
MSDRAAFVRTICEYPDDVAPRLVYADWLDEQGPDERGRDFLSDFIRLQCAEPEHEHFAIGFSETDPNSAHNVPHIFAEKHWNGEESMTWRGIHPIVLGHKPKTPWLIYAVIDFQHWKILDPNLGGRITYRRGFIEELFMPASRFVGCCASIFAKHPIRKVRVNVNPIIGTDGHVYLPQKLPDEIQDRIADRLHPLASTDMLIEEIVVEIISEECVRYGRRKAGLRM